MANPQIKTYQALIYAGDRTNRSRATILLSDDKQNTIGTLVFEDAGTAMPKNETTGVPIGYYPIALYPQVLDLMRNEAPVYLQTDNSGGLSVATLQEPVGEGDKAPVRLFPI